MNLTLVAPKETQVIAACREASHAGHDYALKALIAGQLLIEQRASMIDSHGENRFAHGGKGREEGDQFTKWVAKQLPEVSQPTAYRWMQAAERVSRAQLGIPLHKEFSPVIEICGGETMALSAALTLPEAKLSEAARNYRQGIFEFMADHTLGEAARAVFDGESGAKRITLAAGGKTKGGKGTGDRKAFDEFAKTKLKHLTTFLGQKLTVNQKSQIVAAFDRSLEQWPRWMLEGLAEKCRTELKLSEEQRKQRGGELL